MQSGSPAFVRRSAFRCGANRRVYYYRDGAVSVTAPPHLPVLMRAYGRRRPGGRPAMANWDVVTQD
jgi:hypothetical protein